MAQVPNHPYVRFSLDAPQGDLQAFMARAAAASPLQAAVASAGRFDTLALSGGGYDGSYGAGVVAGWTVSGTRPRFTIVTGVSAGALIAPFAFLGPGYDLELTQSFEGGVADVLGDIGGVFALLGTPDLRHNSLVDLVDKYVTPRLIEAVAREYATGRRLYIVTTNLDAQRGVVWDMGAIASRNAEGTRELFRDVLVASASIPGVFGPTYIEVEANGHRFREMHVDGGAITEVFILPDAVLATRSASIVPKGYPASLWVIINNHVTPQFEVVESGLLPTISRSFSTLIKSNSRETLFATLGFAGSARFNLTYIDDGFDAALASEYGGTLKPGFNQPYMTALFKYGYQRAVSGTAWRHDVPLAQAPVTKRGRLINTAR